MEHFKIDVDWNDNERIDFLFAPFRDRSVNPTSYDIKMKFWVDAIDSWMKTTNRVAFNIEEISEAFITNSGQRPHCLNDVFLHLWNDRRKWILLSDLESSWCLASESSWLMWGLKGSGKLLTIALKSMSPASKVPSSSVFVSIKALESAKENLLSKMRSAPGVMKINEAFFVLAEDLQMKGDEENIVIRHLVGNKFCRVEKISDGRNVIKFSKVALSKSLPEIMKEELDIVRLHILLRDLENSNLQADTKLAEMQLDVRKALRDRQRPKAKEILKTAKRLQGRVDKRRATESIIREILTEIEEASSNAKIIESYSSGLKALKSQLAKTKSLRETQDLMDDIKDAIEDNNDISEALSAGIVDESCDDDALLRELEELDDSSRDASIVDLMDGLRIPDEKVEPLTKATPKKEKMLEEAFS